MSYGDFAISSSFAIILALVGLSKEARYFPGVLVMRIMSAALGSFEIENLPLFSFD